MPCRFTLSSLLTMLTLTLGACGFHLRGAVEIPPALEPIYIQAPAGSPVGAAILQRLEIAGARQAASPKDARTLIRIGGESRSARTLAVDRNGKVLASELHYRVTFDAAGADGKVMVQQQALDLVRTYDNPDVEVLGKQLESDLIYEDLAQDAADRILDRLRARLT